MQFGVRAFMKKICSHAMLGSEYYVYAFWAFGVIKYKEMF